MSDVRWVIVDVESDGPVQGHNSMVCFGAVALTPALDQTFYGQTRPLEPDSSFDPKALAISGFTREQHLTFPYPADTMKAFAEWLWALNAKPIFVSDNPAYDFGWVNWYFHVFHGSNPFGFSGRRIGDIWAGMERSAQAGWKQFRKTKHTHHPVDDAKGNAEALLEMVRRGFKLPGIRPEDIR